MGKSGKSKKVCQASGHTRLVLMCVSEQAKAVKKAEKAAKKKAKKAAKRDAAAAAAEEAAPLVEENASKA